MIEFIKVFLLVVLLYILPTSNISVLAEILEVKLRQNISYDEGKKNLVDSGWQHENLPPYGYQETNPKVSSECYGDVNICNEYPEIDSCSSDGYCLMKFYDHFRNQLFVTTYGPLLTSKLHIVGWTVVENK